MMQFHDTEQTNSIGPITMKTYTLLTLTILTILTISSPAQAESFLQKHFPELFKSDTYEGPDPSKTLIAPFADPSTQTTKSAKKSWASIENSTPLDKSHRSEYDIAKWLIDMTSEIMSFETNNYLKETQKKALYFDEAGWKQYTGFLESSNIKNAISSSQYEIATIVNEAPLILNKGAMNNSYKWLYEVRAIITYKDPNMKNYKNSKPVSQRLKFKIQVGRNKTAQNKHNILIEQWSGHVLSME